jgi:hypothetical protein
MWGYGAPADAADSAMAPPLCWVDKSFDRSPSELVRIDPSAAGWGALGGTLLNLSYGYGRLEVVFADGDGPGAQGALCALPVPDFPTGVMRGRFHPADGNLYLCGLAAWATSQMLQEGGLYRLRPTGRPACLPVSWKPRPGSLELRFSDPPDPADARDPGRFTVKTWQLQRSANYGSPRLDPRTLPVTECTTLADPRNLRLTIPTLAPTMVIEITCRLRDAAGKEVERVITGTIHRL